MSRHDGRPLVLADPTLLVRLEGERLLVQRQGKSLGGVPMHELSHVVAHGPVTFTGAALEALLERGIDVSLLSTGGKLRGVIHGMMARNVFLMLAQVACWNDPPRRLGLSRLLVASKIEGQRRMLQRSAWNRDATVAQAAIETLTVLRSRVDRMEDEDELRGLEGSASAAYFGVFGSMLSAPWTFPGRVRRPPTDPVNALLSFGYTLAVSEITRHLIRRGFDPRVGLFHGLRYGRESLALDLVEEFRAPMVDRFVLRMLNRAQLLPVHFETLPTGAVQLNLQGRRAFFPRWEELLTERGATLRRSQEPPEDDLEQRIARGSSTVTEPPREASSWRHRIERQVSRLHRHLLKGQPYRPLLSEAASSSPPESPTATLPRSPPEEDPEGG